jgi:hypothetical protein
LSREALRSPIPIQPNLELLSEPDWGTGGHSGSFSAYFSHKEDRSKLFMVLGNGKVGFWLYYKMLPPFDDEKKVHELIDRLNEIPGVEIAHDAHEIRFPIAVLKEPEAFKTFTGIMDWIVKEVRRL